MRKQIRIISTKLENKQNNSSAKDRFDEHSFQCSRYRFKKKSNITHINLMITGINKLYNLYTDMHKVSLNI